MEQITWFVDCDIMVILLSYCRVLITYYLHKGDDILMRKQQNINVIVHWPEDQKSMDVIQDATNQLFVKIIENRLSRTNLSPTEKECVVRRVISGLEI